MPVTHVRLVTKKLSAGLSNVYAVKLNDEVVAHAWREQSGKNFLATA